MKEEEKLHVLVMQNGMPVNNGMRISYVIFQAAYWRKANAIHQWFVEHCQAGNDDCGSYEVNREQLVELVRICKAVKQKPELAGPELLPTQEGFFFGDTGYGQWYLEGINETIEQLEKALKDPLQGQFYYQSSW